MTDLLICPICGPVCVNIECGLSVDRKYWVHHQNVDGKVITHAKIRDQDIICKWLEAGATNDRT